MSDELARHPGMLRELALRLEGLPHGETAASRAVFMALGGLFRVESASKQGGAELTLPFWPGEKHPCCGISFSTNELHCLRWLADHKLVHGLWFLPDQAPFWRARVVGSEGMAMTAALALSAALVRHLADEADMAAIRAEAGAEAVA